MTAVVEDHSRRREGIFFSGTSLWLGALLLEFVGPCPPLFTIEFSRCPISGITSPGLHPFHV